MRILAIESSCDETAAAVVDDGRTIRSSIVASQIADHARFGGVVPEIASRKHLEALPLVVDQALEKAGTTWNEIEGVAVTRGPGLVGALLVGLSYAKGVSFAHNLPCVGVHHIEGHILSVLLEQEVAFPYLALAVSGGHTHLYLVEGIGRYRTIGQTRDDAAGEAFDKVAKLMGLPYPGGVVIDRLARTATPEGLRFPRPMLHTPDHDFSFSGIKTAVLNHLEKLGGAPDEVETARVAAAFQEAVVEVLCRKTIDAAKANGIERVVVAGGVACNSGLRAGMNRLAANAGLSCFFPSPFLCGDNAAMMAVAGDFYLQMGYKDGRDLNAVASWPLDRAGRQTG